MEFETSKEVENILYALEGQVDFLVNYQITLGNLEKWSKRLIAIISSIDILEEIITLIFQHAIIEPDFAIKYAALCRKMSESNELPTLTEFDGRVITFKRALLGRCQSEFEAGIHKQVRKERLTPEEIWELEEKQMLDNKRYLGFIKFIGELFRVDMLTVKIMNYCMMKLLAEVKNPSEEAMEGLCKLMTIIGKKLSVNTSREYMNAYFARIVEITQRSCLPIRIKLMLQELVELRNRNWIPRQTPTPKDNQRSAEK